MKLGLLLHTNRKREFSPGSIPGLLFRLTAAKGISLNGNAVSAWADQSGNGFHFIQNTAIHQPLYIQNGVNNKPAVRFNGTASELATVQSGVFSLQQAITLFIALKRNSTLFKNYETLLSQGYGTQLQAVAFGFGYSGQVSPAPAMVTDTWKPSGLQSNSTVNVTSPSVLTYMVSSWQTHRAAGSSLRLNGVSVSIKTYGSGEPAGVQNMPLRLGSFGPTLSEGYFEGDIAEVICYNRNLNEAELIQAETYLKSRYGVV